MARLIERLPDGPLDVIGDVHGEIEALQALLARLGYADDGRHPDGRSLVFVGDLVDRGPDSPAVLRLVQGLVEQGIAQCIVGNHELNLLRGDEKHGNSWWTAPDASHEHPMEVIQESDKPGLFRFLQDLPLILERDDLRIVHACWNPVSVAAIRALNDKPHGIADLYDYFVKKTTEEMLANKFLAFVRREWKQHNPKLQDRDWSPTYMPGLAELHTRTQMDNPVAVLTSGAEGPAGKPFWAGGRWRMVKRETWWDSYAHDCPVIIGHYWRRISTAALGLRDKFGPDVLEGIEPHHWMGQRGNVYCVDFSVGARAEQRRLGLDEFVCKLAAVRVPEWQVLHDDGECYQLGAPGNRAAG